MIPNIKRPFPTINLLKKAYENSEKHIYRPKKKTKKQKEKIMEVKKKNALNLVFLKKIIQEKIKSLVDFLDPNKVYFVKKPPKVYRCPYCEKVLRTHQSIGGHVTKNHPEKRKDKTKMISKEKVRKYKLGGKKERRKKMLERFYRI